MIGILFFAIATSIAYFAAPSMPLFSARDIEIVNFHISLTNMTISAKILAGVEIDNGNIVGGDLYSTLVDVYYPDWNGNLQSIGYLHETRKDGNECRTAKSSSEEDHGICISEETNPLPIFSVQPLGVSTSKPGIVTIYLQNLAPRTYLSLLKDLIFQLGSIELLVSGGAHVKSPLGLMLSLGVICDNVLDLTKHPIQIVGRSCSVESVSTGWDGLKELASEVKDKIIGYHQETNGDIFNRRGREEAGNERIQSGMSENSIDNFFSTSEMILDWHDF
jgi:hypothetical protein